MPAEDRLNKISCKHYRHEIEITLELLNGKWISIILLNLEAHDTIRFSKFQKIIPDVSQKMLTQQLKKLEKNLLIKREVFNTVPPIVEYSLTDLGKSLLPILDSLSDWGKLYLEKFLEHEDSKKIKTKS